mgnify:CR=1 FL=1|tara:strand:+ start:126 stop:638 length:513 start_codon:yes stop_codon:yes gene_type:complete
MIFKIINFVLFQAAWFVCVLGASYNQTYLALPLSIIILLIHFSLIKKRMLDLKLIIIAGLIGLLFDGVLLNFDLIIYNDPGLPYPYTPIWIVMLWMIFAMTLNHSLAWLSQKYYLAILFGAIGGPLAYIAGEKLGAITLLSTNSIITLSIGWALITPILLVIANELNKNA